MLLLLLFCVVLIDAGQRHMVVLIGISLTTNDAEHPFLCLCASQNFSVKCPFKSSSSSSFYSFLLLDLLR